MSDAPLRSHRTTPNNHYHQSGFSPGVISNLRNLWIEVNPYGPTRFCECQQDGRSCGVVDSYVIALSSCVGWCRRWMVSEPLHYTSKRDVEDGREVVQAVRVRKMRHSQKAALHSAACFRTDIVFY